MSLARRWMSRTTFACRESSLRGWVNGRFLAEY